jgi:hypothetical protein
MIGPESGDGLAAKFDWQLAERQCSAAENWRQQHPETGLTLGIQETFREAGIAVLKRIYEEGGYSDSWHDLLGKLNDTSANEDAVKTPLDFIAEYYDELAGSADNEHERQMAHTRSGFARAVAGVVIARAAILSEGLNSPFSLKMVDHAGAMINRSAVPSAARDILTVHLKEFFLLGDAPR